MCAALGAVQVADLSRDGVTISVDADPAAVDPARDFYVTLTMSAPSGMKAVLPDLRDRFRGFRVAEDFEDAPATTDGTTTVVSRWRLVPEPAAESYRLAPFAVKGDGWSFATAPVRFEPPPAREAVTGGMEIAPSRDLPPLSWKLVGIVAAMLSALAAIVFLAWTAVRKVRSMIRIHRMSPIERAMYELGKLLEKGLPGRGFYKDFYVELTMVVRRYIERRHGIRAPRLTTEEFLRAAEGNPDFPQESIDRLRQFLRSADMVKFAGVEATPETSDEAVDSAREYLKTDSAAEVAK